MSVRIGANVQKPLMIISVVALLIGCTGKNSSQPSPVRAEPAAPIPESVENAVPEMPNLSAYDKAVLAATDPLSPTRLVLAARYGDDKTVEYLMQRGVSVNARDNSGQTALSAAAAAGQPNIVAKLLAGGADVNAKGADGQTALMAAATSGRSEIAAMLLKAGAQADAVNSIGETALFNAVKFGQLDTVKVLLAHGADANIQNQAEISSSISGYTPLMYAAEHGVTGTGDWPAIVEMLLAKGAEPNLKNLRGDSALSIAVKSNSQDVIPLLTQAGARVERSYTSLNEGDALVKAAALGDLFKVKQILDSGADPDVANEFGVTPLLAAAYSGRVEVAKALMQRGVKVNSVPLGLREWAAESSRAPTNQRALMESASNGDSPLLVASRQGHAELVKFLLKNKADPQLANNKGEAAIFAAAEQGHADVIKILLEHGVNPNGYEPETPAVMLSSKVRGTGRNTALIKAAQAGHTKAATVLLNGGAHPNVRGLMGRTALLWAVERGYVATAEELLKAKADPNIRDMEGQLPLIVAARNGNAKLTRLLLDYKADVNTPEVADLAGDRGNAFGTSGMTALIYAARGGHDDVVRMLVEAGADINAMSTGGVTALKEASTNGYKEIVKLLEVAGSQIE